MSGLTKCGCCGARVAQRFTSFDCSFGLTFGFVCQDCAESLDSALLIAAANYMQGFKPDPIFTP